MDPRFRWPAAETARNVMMRPEELAMPGQWSRLPYGRRQYKTFSRMRVRKTLLWAGIFALKIELLCGDPMLTFIAETREYVWGELRNGDRPTGKQIGDHLRGVRAALPPGVKQIYGRADSGF